MAAKAKRVPKNTVKAHKPRVVCPETGAVSICVMCAIHPSLKRFVRDHGAVGYECGICHRSDQIASSPADYGALSSLIRALIRFHYDEWTYNRHWGGNDEPESLLCRENDIVEHAPAPGFPRSAETSEEFLVGLFDPPYPDYDKGISIYAGHHEKYGRLPPLDALGTSMSPLYKKMAERLSKENYFQVEDEFEKLLSKLGAGAGNHRNCREPLVENIQADFHGDNAKLIWVVSLDGKKMQSETYKVLAILDKPQSESSHNAEANNLQNFAPPTTASAMPQDLFWWFDETAPVPGAPLFEVVVTARAYDGALDILRKARQGNTSVQAGTSVLDSGYHPATVNLDSWQKSNPNSTPSLFYWQGEEVNGATQIMHFQMTKRAYEQMLALVAGSDLRFRPSQSSNQAR